MFQGFHDGGMAISNKDSNTNTIYRESVYTVDWYILIGSRISIY